MNGYETLLHFLNKEITILVKCNGEMERVSGKLQGFDEHMNILLCSKTSTVLYLTKHIIEYILPRENHS
ncbi:hypothetical protein NEAUS06_0636 [Nematocida ausubeli]|nr:hypothetical protein NEAUS06_0636 [Nematocida ausubeli]